MITINTTKESRNKRGREIFDDWNLQPAWQGNLSWQTSKYFAWHKYTDSRHILIRTCLCTINKKTVPVWLWMYRNSTDSTTYLIVIINLTPYPVGSKMFSSISICQEDSISMQCDGVSTGGADSIDGQKGENTTLYTVRPQHSLSHCS